MSSTQYSVLTTSRARTREGDAIDELAQCYCDALSRQSCPQLARSAMVDAMARGMEAFVICRALEAAMDAPRPSWAYARAIIDRCLAERCLTAEQWGARDAAHRARGMLRHPGSRGTGKAPESSVGNPALNYAQRPVDDGRYAHLFADLHDAMGNQSDDLIR